MVGGDTNKPQRTPTVKTVKTGHFWNPCRGSPKGHFLGVLNCSGTYNRKISNIFLLGFGMFGHRRVESFLHLRSSFSGLVHAPSVSVSSAIVITLSHIRTSLCSTTITRTHTLEHSTTNFVTSMINFFAMFWDEGSSAFISKLADPDEMGVLRGQLRILWCRDDHFSNLHLCGSTYGHVSKSRARFAHFHPFL